MKRYLVALMLTFLACPHLSEAQEILTKELRYQIDNVLPPFATTREHLAEADSIVHLNKHYKTWWIDEFVSVEVSAIHNGEKVIAMGENDVFTNEQKVIMKNADSGTDISIYVRYMPNNTLSHNDEKDFFFSFMVLPDNEATYPGGVEKFGEYLKENAIDNIENPIIEDNDITAIKFMVDEEGLITDAKLFWSCKNEELDKLLLEAICNMPKWTPAHYVNGHKVKQEFALTVGNLESCVINMLGTRPF
ncbi:MAG: energy transducer TonB [Bacteroidota bacterium]